MNSLTLLDSFLSRSLSATPRSPSPPDSPPTTPNGSVSGGSGSSPASSSSTSAAAEDEALAPDDDSAQHAASSSSSSRMPRRNSDHVLSTSRNRLKRSERFALGFGMTSAADDGDVGKRRGQQVNRIEDGQDEDRPRHGKSFSEGGRLRRSGSIPASQHLDRDTSSPPSWSSSLWGLGSWLDPQSERRGGHRRRSGSSLYAPGESLDDEEERRQQRRERRRARRAKREAEQRANEQNGVEARAGADGHDSDTSIGTTASTSSTSSSREAGPSSSSSSTLVRRPSRLDISGRLLFANRIFTPFHHPSLTASVPNLPSEVGAATAGLGGMEDVQTVDFEGGESDTEIDDATEAAAAAAATAALDKAITPPAASGRLKRHATVSTPTAAEHDNKRRRSHPDRDDYFGPRAVEREQKRMETTEDSSSSSDGHGGMRESREVSAELKDEELSQRASLEEEQRKAPPPPYTEAAGRVEADEEKTKTTPPAAPRPSLTRRILAFLRRAILAILLAPVDAVTFIFSSRGSQAGKGKQKLIAVTVSAASPSSPSPISAKASLKFRDEASPGKTEKRGSIKRRPTPKPECRAQESPDDVVTEDQAQEKAEGQACTAPSSDQSASPSRASRLLPNPHSVDPMLVHEPKAKKVTGELPEKSQSFQAWRPAATPPTVPRTAAVIHHTPKILVLDLDETLIHSTSRSPTWTALRNQHSSKAEAAARSTVSTGGSLLGLDGLGGLLGLTGSGSASSKFSSVRPHMVEVVLDGRSVIYHVYKRPYVDVFLRKVASWYHVVIFTASVQEYADPVIDWLDQGRGLIAGRLFRDACTYKNGSYLKNLSIVDGDLSRVCLVDNSPASYHLNPSNGIPVEGWTHDAADEGLLDLLPVLDSLRFAQDVRHVLGLRITESQQAGAAK